MSLLNLQILPRRIFDRLDNKSMIISMLGISYDRISSSVWSWVSWPDEITWEIWWSISKCISQSIIILDLERVPHGLILHIPMRCMMTKFLRSIPSILSTLQEKPPF